MENPMNSKSDQILVLVAFLAPFVIATLGCWVWNLQAQLDLVRYENAALQEKLQPQVACAPVHVTCECPDYDEGWEDSEYMEGCEPEELDVEDLRVICDELNQYGYIPGC
jgi:hypothetical protein